MNFTPSGINHITIRVNRIDASKEFYGDILDLELVKTMGQSMAVYKIGEK
ncbi:MAG TPA: VOC family protein, partial [Balneolaceae bacterium]|nr:VOC family protein [Balneolaceae bacterium]